ncbi:MAG: protein phosphatase [Actinobacteria bacterium]|uniref:Unannotated protein n=1 Tax=freshwater metagenome TaxID=449393 RepID=A0A6J6FK89_9ZZZZ|nr:protein phosphatase [Actinomycetota bacterium]
MAFDSDGFIEPPLESEILPRLWMGGTHEDETLTRVRRLHSVGDRKFFDAVVTLDSNSAPMGWLVKEFRFGFPDAALDLDHAAELERIADWAYTEWKAGSTVLIRCQAGLNRSGLVTALILLRDRMKLEEVLRVIRSVRGDYALSNSHFVEYLEKWKSER